MVKSLTGSDRVITVLNRADTKRGVVAKLIEKGLGAPPDIVVPDLGPGMLEAFNLGVPALQRVPALGRRLSPLVREIAGTQTAADRSWFARTFRP